MEEKTKQYMIQGLVQGVWYRQSTLEKARQLDLSGWVKNLADGRVQVLASGSEANLQALEDWLWRGPPLAQVDQVESQIVETYSKPGFKILR